MKTIKTITFKQVSPKTTKVNKKKHVTVFESIAMLLDGKIQAIRKVTDKNGIEDFDKLAQRLEHDLIRANKRRYTDGEFVLNMKNADKLALWFK